MGDTDTKLSGRNLLTPTPKAVAEAVKNNPGTTMAIILSVLLTGGGSTMLNRLFPPEPSEAHAAAAQPDPLVNYRLGEIEKRLEKIEKLLDGKRR